MPGASYQRLLARLESVRTLGVSLGLDRVREALTRLGLPQRMFASVQIAGTNGKGSTAAMAESILRAGGFRTGLFTSPHLCRFTERIRIDGREADGDRLAMLDAHVAATKIPLTYFEVATVLALLAMAEAGVEVAVLETGLGGRLDAVTAADPIGTAITSIGLDHTEVLGKTLREIAREKAGIARAGVPLFLGKLPPEADEEIVRVAAAVNAPIVRVGADLPLPTAKLGLLGTHQAGNAALAVALAQQAAVARRRPLAPEAGARGLESVRWPGRLEWVAADVLLDCAHNVDGARALAAALPARTPRALVTSIVRDKDASGMLAALAPAFSLIVATCSRSDRALTPEALAGIAASVASTNTAVETAAEPFAALARARTFVSSSATGGFVLAAGSIFLVGDLRARLLGEKIDPVGTGDPMP